MNQKKIGEFMKELRREKSITQEQLAEIMCVSNRTVSRWETGSNLPDICMIIELADYYNVDLEELLDGERRSEKMNEELKETVLKVADFTNDEKIKLMRKLHVFSWIGVVSFIVFMILEYTDLVGLGITKNIADFCLGLAFGMLIIALLYTSKYISKFSSFKKRVLKSK